MRVLVVDDNADSADSLGLLVTQMGHEARIVYDGPSALCELLGDWADVAVLDIGMPDMSGYEVASRLPTRAGRRRPLLVALSGWGREEDHARSEAAGFAAHLTKPIDYDVLRSLLSRLGAGRRDGGAQ